MDKAAQNQELLLHDELKRTGGNLSKVARTLGIPYRDLISRYGGNKIPTFVPPSRPEPADIRELGREGWKGWVIAAKRAGEAWPAKYDNVIKDARVSFDNGTHEMYQTTDNGWVALYLIPRTRSIQRKPFFASMEDE